MKRPNVLLILTDDQGWGDLSCKGNGNIRTPHIDRLAASGTRFANAYCVNSVCSPSRAAYMTGLLPSQHGVHVIDRCVRKDTQISHSPHVDDGSVDVDGKNGLAAGGREPSRASIFAPCPLCRSCPG